MIFSIKSEHNHIEYFFMNYAIITRKKTIQSFKRTKNDILILNFLLKNAFDDMKYLQFVIMAKKQKKSLC